MKKRLAILLLLLLVVGCREAPDEISGERPERPESENKQALANKYFVDALKTLEGAQQKTGNAALSDYESTLTIIQQITNDLCETDLAVSLLSGKPLLLGKSLKQLELRVSILKALPEQVLSALDNATDGKFVLSFWGDLVTDDTLEHLQEVPITSLRLEEASISDSGLAYLKNIRTMKGLSLKDTQITDAGLVHLQMLTNLEQLNLSNVTVTDAGLLHIEGMTKLQLLSLENTQITDAGLEKLKGMLALEKLWISGTQVTPKGVAMLENRLPHCNIIYDSASSTAAETDDKHKGSDLSSPQKALALYFGSRTWGERSQYTIQEDELPSQVQDAGHSRTYSNPDNVNWPTGVPYKIESITNASGQDGDQIGATLIVNLNQAEGLVRNVRDGNDVYFDCADLTRSYSYFLKNQEGYRIDWEKTRSTHESQLAEFEESIAKNANQIRELRRESAKQLKRLQAIAKWNLYDAALSIVVVRVDIKKAVTTVHWQVTNRSLADIAGVTVKVYVTENGKRKVLDELRMDDLKAGKLIEDKRLYPTTQGGRSFRENGWTARISSLRLERGEERFFAEDYFELRRSSN